MSNQALPAKNVINFPKKGEKKSERKVLILMTTLNCCCRLASIATRIVKGKFAPFVDVSRTNETRTDGESKNLYACESVSLCVRCCNFHCINLIMKVTRETEAFECFCVVSLKNKGNPSIEGYITNAFCMNLLP
jgi:hypothetical protein